MHKYFFAAIILFFIACAVPYRTSAESDHQKKIEKSQKLLYLKQALYTKAITQVEYDSLEARLIDPRLDINLSKVLNQK
jgi:hypothetical protein